MSDSQSQVKVCIICGQDCSNDPRFKNDQGQYLHESCYSANPMHEPAPVTASTVAELPAAGPSSLRTVSAHPDVGKPRPARAVKPSRRSNPGNDRSVLDLFLSFDGRVSRMEYWGAAAGVSFMNFVIFAIVSATGVSVIGLLYLVTMWAMIGLNVKRWHDRDKSGYWFFPFLYTGRWVDMAIC